MLLAAGAVLVGCAPFHAPEIPRPPESATGRLVTREDAVADLDALVRTLENVHPNLYAVRPRDSVAAQREQIVAQLPASMSRLEWWTRLAPLMANFGDGHTSIGYPGDEVLRMQNAGALIFPPSVGRDADGRFVITAPFTTTAGLSRGDRLETINGHGVDSLIQRWARKFSGESEVFRTTMVADAFRDLLMIHGVTAPYALVVAGRDGAERHVSLEGITRDSLVTLVRSNRAAAAAPARNFAYQLLPGAVGYMNFRTMSGELGAFESDIAAMFTRIAADSARVLVIDVRTNGGGDSRLGDALLRHITTQPYRESARKDWKMSKEYRKFLKSAVRPPLAWLPIQYFFPLGRKLYTGPDGKIATFDEPVQTPRRTEPFFAGPVCVLMGPRTFSSAVDFVDAVKTYHLATTIGEETGGRPNAFGEVYPFLLPKSGFPVSVSSASFVRANGDTSDHRGVIPEVVIEPTAADRRAGRDPVMDRARGCGAVHP